MGRLERDAREHSGDHDRYYEQTTARRRRGCDFQSRAESTAFQAVVCSIHNARPELVEGQAPGSWFDKLTTSGNVLAIRTHHSRGHGPRYTAPRPRPDGATAGAVPPRPRPPVGAGTPLASASCIASANVSISSSVV